MKKRALIDGDVVLYEVTASCEQAYDWGDDMWTLHSDFREARQKFDCWVADMNKVLETDQVLVALSDKQNWRKSVLETYKANRKGKRKPLTYPALRRYVEQTYKVSCMPTLEADDVLGIHATDPKKKTEDIVVTIDKDLKTVPGFHFNPNHPEDGVVEVSREQADFNHLMQSVAGDPVDGYSGCPGIGPVRAERMLKDCPNWQGVVKIYESKSLSSDDALLQARVARILRYGEYDLMTETVKLWSPDE
tara:strand:- start:3116 stop:3859 length:744 start_codon:yes stop_codon:yes gene_type:complete